MFEQEAVKEGLKKLMAKQYFDICTLDNIAEAMGVKINQSPKYKYLRLLHCVDYADMSEQVRTILPNIILEVLRPQVLPGEVIAKALLLEGKQHTAWDEDHIATLSN